MYPEMALNLRGKFLLTSLPAKHFSQTKQRRPHGSHDCSSSAARNRIGIIVLCPISALALDLLNAWAH
jgi:hypothetical protein